MIILFLGYFIELLNFTAVPRYSGANERVICRNGDHEETSQLDRSDTDPREQGHTSYRQRAKVRRGRGCRRVEDEVAQ